MRPFPKNPDETLFPKKHLGQHFLVDKNIQERIIAACEIGPEDVVLEIGPGWGALSTRIAGQTGEFYAVEKDQQLYRRLKEYLSGPHIHLIHADILKFEMDSLPPLNKIIGNLPYNIASLIIIKLLQHRLYNCRFFFTVQAEFAQRLTAEPDTKDYGAFTCFAQYFCDSKILFNIKNTSFRPIPKVLSSFVRIQPREFTGTTCRDEELLFTIIRQAFQQRRKIVLNALSPLIPKDILSPVLCRLKINEKIRPENLSLADYILMTNMISKSEKQEGRLNDRHPTP